MDYKDFCECLPALKLEAEKYNKFREEALVQLLTVTAPQVLTINNSFLIERLGKIVASLAHRVEFNSTNYAKIEDICSDNLITKVLYESLLKDVAEIYDWMQKHPKR